MPETKTCEACEQEIGANETKCPKCGVVFDELEQEIAVVTRAQTVVEKRRKKTEPPPAPPAPPKRKSIFSSLAGKD